MVIKDNIDALYLSLLNYIFTFIRTVATTLNSAILCNIQKEYYRFGIYFEKSVTRIKNIIQYFDFSCKILWYY